MISVRVKRFIAVVDLRTIMSRKALGVQGEIVSSLQYLPEDKFAYILQSRGSMFGVDQKHDAVLCSRRSQR